MLLLMMEQSTIYGILITCGKWSLSNSGGCACCVVHDVRVGKRGKRGGRTTHVRQRSEHANWRCRSNALESWWSCCGRSCCGRSRGSREWLLLLLLLVLLSCASTWTLRRSTWFVGARCIRCCQPSNEPSWWHFSRRTRFSRQRVLSLGKCWI